MTAKLLLLLPLLSAIVVTFVTRRSGTLSSFVSVGAATVGLILSLALLGMEDQTVKLFSWANLGDSLQIDIGLKVDGLSRGMMFVVTFIGALVHWFSLGYMKDDAGKARYFGALSLFMFSMIGIVLADNFLMMFIFWELVGLSSYLLIGHWFTKDSAAEASKKAFLTNRVGDFGFMLGILVVFGLTGAIGFEVVEAKIGDAAAKYPGYLTLAALLLFCGAVGKSAQFPLHVWLPDAMEGPTPVSALIHAATMVAAGVYMLARVFFVIAESACASMIIAWVGGITALLAALMATQQDDIKRILAYSTLSQLGYMVMAVGLADPNAGMFHLFTHAFFKALLFLGAGAVIYACHHQQDIWKMGGLREKMPITFATFAAGTLALVAFPWVTAGFWSKEAILAAAWHENKLLFLVAAGVAFLTAFYMTRLFVVVFLGEARSEDAGHAKEVPMIMWVPLCILAVFAIVAGYIMFWKDGPFSAFIPAHHDEGMLFVLIVSLATVAFGVVLGLVRYLDKKSEPRPVSLFANKFYIDEAYATLIRYCQDGLAWVLRGLDSLFIDGIAVGGVARLVEGAGSLLRRMQVGNLQGYVFLFGAGIFLVIYLLVFFL